MKTNIHNKNFARILAFLSVNSAQKSSRLRMINLGVEFVAEKKTRYSSGSTFFVCSKRLGCLDETGIITIKCELGRNEDSEKIRVPDGI